MGVPPNNLFGIHLNISNRIFHEINHPFWGITVSPFKETSIYSREVYELPAPGSRYLPLKSTKSAAQQRSGDAEHCNAEPQP